MIRSLRKTDLVWRYGFNFSPTMKHIVGGNGSGRLTGVERDLVSSLRTDGVAVSSVEELFGDTSAYLELVSGTGEMLDARSQEIDGLRKSADADEDIGVKTFNLEMLGSTLSFDPHDVFARFALSAPILRIANAYLQMAVLLRYYNVWKTFASNGKSRESQLWHVDREDNYILKMFLYLDDVDEGAGPFTYAPGTQRNGRNRAIEPEFFIEGGVRRTTDEQMKAVLPESDWIRCTGKKGTLILADTAGYHKGGEARTKDRLMYTCMYTSRASESKRLLNIPVDLDPAALAADQRTALGI